MPTFDQIYAYVRMVPRGKVVTYGQIARLVGGISAQMVGFAMASTPKGSEVPWQRVINAKGRISPHGFGYGSAMQEALLREEGVEFGPDGTIDLQKFGWTGPE